MNRILLTSFISCSLAASSAFAVPSSGSGNIGRVDGTYGPSGGEYTITAESPSDFGSFQTFCLELRDPLAGNPFLFRLNESAVGGGLTTGPDGGADFDPVSKGTAWLYKQFASGNWAEYDYTPGTGREESAYGLQRAIWYLEGESDYLNDLGAKYVKLAFAVFGDKYMDGDFGDQKVFAMNIFDAQGNRYQDMLALGVPDGGATMMLLGIGFLGLGFLRRRFA
jgi:hypothetical protein